MNTPPRMLITGASGLLGQEMCSHFKEKVTLVRQGFAHGHSQDLACDLREPRDTRILVEEARPDLVVHCAAYREPDYCEEHQQDARALNVGAVESLLHALPAAARFVLISTDYVFDGEHPPYGETSPVCPVSEYGRHKAEAEAMVAQRPGSLILRIPVLVGPDPRPNKPGFLQQMAHQIRSGHAAVVDDVLVRHPTWTRDVAEALDFLLSRGESGIYHASSPEGGTRYQLTCKLAGLLGLSHAHLTPSKTVIHRAARRPHNSQLSSAKLASLGFTGFNSFAEVVRVLLAD
jgi:dTDP-4-dehydrorhamnose reductase